MCNSVSFLDINYLKQSYLINSIIEKDRDAQFDRAHILDPILFSIKMTWIMNSNIKIALGIMW